MDEPGGSGAPGDRRFADSWTESIRGAQPHVLEIAATTRPHETEKCRELAREDETLHGSLTWQLIAFSLVALVCEEAFGDFHTAEVTGSIPVSPTTRPAFSRAGFQTRRAHAVRRMGPPSGAGNIT